MDLKEFHGCISCEYYNLLRWDSVVKQWCSWHTSETSTRALCEHYVRRDTE